MLNFLKNKKRISLNKGFTLIELLITISIFVLLTVIVLFSQGNFNNSILLSNLAYDISLTVRQTQEYGSGVQESLFSSNSFPSYGIYFNGTDKTKPLTNFIIFGNPDLTKVVNGTLTTELFTGSTLCSFGDPQCIQKYNIGNGSYISRICASDNEIDCNNSSAAVNEMYIIFKRPLPNAIIYGGVSGTFNKSSQYAKITISSASGATTSVVVTGLGQIYVEH